MLARIFQCALAARGDPRAMCIHYRELPEAVFDRIAPHFGVSLNDDETARAREITAFDAKNPSLYFEPDSEAKQGGATPRVRGIYDQLLKDMYGELMEWESQSGL